MIDRAIALPTVDIVPVPVGMINVVVPLIAVAVILQVPEVEPGRVIPPAGNVMPVVPSKIRLMLITLSDIYLSPSESVPSSHPIQNER